MSELYELPDGWEWKTLDQVSKILGGGTPKRNINEYWKNGHIVWLSPTDLGKIGDVDEISNSKDKITQLGLEKSSAKLLPIGTVLFSSRATIGKIAINTIEVSTNQGFANFVCNSDLLNKYLAYCLSRFTEAITSLSNSTTFKEVSKSSLKEFKIPLPPLPEQQRIVSKLDLLFEKIDKSIALHQKNMDEANAFMGSVLNDIFGELEEKYEKKQLHTVIKIIGGGTPSKSEKTYWDNGNIKWATVGDMNVETIVDTELSITEIGLKNSSSNIIPKEAIIIATRVGLGKVCYLNFDTAINQDLKGLLPLNDKLDIRFLFNYFKNIKEYIISNGTGATVKGVKLDFIKELEIPLPALPIQQKVVTYLDEISQKIEKIKQLQKEKMASLKALKASILDSAFRGEL
ncbi:MAG: restriction endonuclease subunit S [Sulfurimonas sp.]|nr:restriction endonuclease subunit S [Sulfurimonas sp.]